GWDTHGHPVEIEVEKALGLSGRHEIGEGGRISVADYNRACRESVLRYKDLWDGLTRRMGYWVDLYDPYVTFHNAYIESVWALLKAISEKHTADGEPFLYRGHKIQWYSPASGTVLSSHEVSLGYKEVQDPSITVRFPVEGQPDTYFLARTTTPWTLVANEMLAVGPELDYVKVRVTSEVGNPEYLILATARLANLVQGAYEVVEELKGLGLVGTKYTPVFDTYLGWRSNPHLNIGDKLWTVASAGFVSIEDGTGVVHMAPA